MKPQPGEAQAQPLTAVAPVESAALGTLAKLTGAKAVANTALRWIPPFLPTLERAFSASTTQLTSVLGLGELAGLTTVAIGPALDRGHERAVMVAGLGLISVSSIVALGGSLTTFAIAFVLLIVGVANFTVGGHAWISRRVEYHWRARAIGIFETSWALALLVGGPIVAVLINAFGWRGPFVFLAIACAAAALLVALTLPRTDTPLRGDHRGTEPARSNERLTARAWFVVVGAALMAASGLSVFVISGSWLDDAFGVSTSGLGYVTLAIGAFELIASTGTAAFADRVGKLRSTLAGQVVLGIGLLIMLTAGGRLSIGVIGLLVFLLGFEFGFVTSLSLISEAMPNARGRTLAIANAMGTVARGGGVVVSGWLFDTYGISGSASFSGAAVVLSCACFVASRRDR